MDLYWQEVFRRSVTLQDRNTALLSEKGEDELRIRSLLSENTDLSEKLEAANSTCKALMRENTYLRGLLKRYLYPAFAEVLLQKSNHSSEKNPFLKPEAFQEGMEPHLPLPFDGLQITGKPVETRQEKLLKALQKQVNGDDDED